MHILSRAFYSRQPEVVAPELIGKSLVRNLGYGLKLEGIIVETEAYGGANDPASHAFHGKTSRNAAMFGEAGHSYVYFTYGFHHCLNFVTGAEGDPGAVLIRAIEPKVGLREMMRRRNAREIENIASGPGKVCQALSIDGCLNNIDVAKRGAAIQVKTGEEERKYDICSSARIGIREGKERNWRFYACGSKFISQRYYAHSGISR